MTSYSLSTMLMEKGFMGNQMLHIAETCISTKPVDRFSSSQNNRWKQTYLFTFMDFWTAHEQLTRCDKNLQNFQLVYSKQGFTSYFPHVHLLCYFCVCPLFPHSEEQCQALWGLYESLPHEQPYVSSADSCWEQHFVQWISRSSFKQAVSMVL